VYKTIINDALTKVESALAETNQLIQYDNN